jgi:hypothetical protein
MLVRSFIRKLVIVFSLAAILVCIVGYYQPQDVTVQKTILIQAPKEQVMAEIKYFKNWQHWNPWQQLDSNMLITYKGTDGDTGSSLHWIGDVRKVGSVHITNTRIDAQKMYFSFELIKPEYKAYQGSLAVYDSLTQTTVTFQFGEHYDYPWNAMLIFANLDKFYGKDLTKALENMKDYTEHHKY